METYTLYGDTSAATQQVLSLLSDRGIQFTFSLIDGHPSSPVLSTSVGRFTGLEEIRRFLQKSRDAAAHQPCAF